MNPFEPPVNSDEDSPSPFDPFSAVALFFVFLLLVLDYLIANAFLTTMLVTLIGVAISGWLIYSGRSRKFAIFPIIGFVFRLVLEFK